MVDSLLCPFGKNLHEADLCMRSFKRPISCLYGVHKATSNQGIMQGTAVSIQLHAVCKSLAFMLYNCARKAVPKHIWNGATPVQKPIQRKDYAYVCQVCL